MSAAGNDYCGDVSYPAAYPESMAVAALDTDGESRADYSNCGYELDIAAVGSSIWDNQ